MLGHNVPACVSVEGRAACLRGVSKRKAQVWIAKHVKDHAAFGAGIKNTADRANHIANIEPEAPSTLLEILPIVGAGIQNTKHEWSTVMSASLMCEGERMTNCNSTSNIQVACVWPNCLLRGPATKHFPYTFWHLSHSGRLLDSFLPSVAQAAHTCLASTLHA